MKRYRPPHYCKLQSRIPGASITPNLIPVTAYLGPSQTLDHLGIDKRVPIDDNEGWDFLEELVAVLSRELRYGNPYKDCNEFFECSKDAIKDFYRSSFCPAGTVINARVMNPLAVYMNAFQPIFPVADCIASLIGRPIANAWEKFKNAESRFASAIALSVLIHKINEHVHHADVIDEKRNNEFYFGALICCHPSIRDWHHIYPGHQPYDLTTGHSCLPVMFPHLPLLVIRIWIATVEGSPELDMLENEVKMWTVATWEAHPSSYA